jgi:hypothetical protein
MLYIIYNNTNNIYIYIYIPGDKSGQQRGEDHEGKEGREVKQAVKKEGVQFRLSCTTTRHVQAHKLAVKTCHPAGKPPDATSV